MVDRSSRGAPSQRARRSFSSALVSSRRSGIVPVVPDVKARSPKEGDLLQGRDPVAYAQTLVKAGAPAISVVTEPTHFDGSMAMLEAITQGVDVPVLRKDFIQREDELEATRAAGADAVLLIAVHLSPERLAALIDHARHIGLESVVEVHNEEELQRALTLPFDVLGVNNRDIANLERDHGTVERSASLASKIPPDVLWISESGIHTPDDVQRAAASGATAVLIGTELLQAGDPARRWKELAGANAY